MEPYQSPSDTLSKGCGPGVTSFTVVIPHLDDPKALTQCLASLAAERQQAAISFTAIVVDNGSRRRPVEVCDAHPFVRLVDEPEPGPGPARSRGARQAQTPLVAFLDSDCTVRPGWAQAIIKHFAASPDIDVIGGDVRIAFVDPARPVAVEAYEAVYGYRMKMYVERDHYTATCNMAVRRQAFLKVGDFAGIRIAEDVDWGRRATEMGLRIGYVPEMVIETPARASFAELARKWDRHIDHDFTEVTSVGDRIRWVARALMLAISPLIEGPRIVRSDRLSGARARLLAWACLTRVRLYRCRRMLALLFGFGRSSATAWRGG